ncbi:hypothetical protein D6C78_06118 [Aureobasidium pullulans]|uniref:Uncharacterized protein n=1 Tax=Aureobasidium pullulans TaxID=5580 RepID=A0A4T0BMD3_AURPU|nr:hypothetical protein D6C78_06118 [Aureobasidium pullulans]
MNDNGMNTDRKEQFLWERVYQEAQIDVAAANERIQTVIGWEQEARDAQFQLIIGPWHMPLPRELQRQLPKPPVRKITTAVNLDPQKLPIDRTVPSQNVRMSNRQTEPSNQLERILHNKHLAEQLASTQSTMPVTQPFLLREIDLPILTKSGNVGKGPTETANTLKRKLSKLKDPQDTEDGSLTEVLPKYSILPTFRQQFHISEPNSESTSPPRRHIMPPIEAVLAHGFRNINLNRRTEPPITPRSHAFDPWTDLLLGHRVLTPTPAFLLSLSAFRSDDSEDSYWKSSLPVIISYHLANPANLVDETRLESLTFCLPAPKEYIFFDTRTGRRVPTRARQPNHKYEGPETNTEIRMIRMVLPPIIPKKLYERKDQQEPFTDWLILCLSTPAAPPPAVAHTHHLRSTTQVPPQPYTMIVFPTHLFKEKEFVASETSISPVDQQEDVATTMMMRFDGRGKLPLMYGINRDSAFAERWVQGFAKGGTALELTFRGTKAPCWM